MTANLGHFCDPERNHFKGVAAIDMQGKRYPNEADNWPRHESCSGLEIIHFGASDGRSYRVSVHVTREEGHNKKWVIKIPTRRKPHNYWNEATPEQREEWTRQEREKEESANISAAVLRLQR